jgi:hypothetical protein
MLPGLSSSPFSVDEETGRLIELDVNSESEGARSSHLQSPSAYSNTGTPVSTEKSTYREAVPTLVT